MKPIQFPGVNVVYAEDQPEYLPLPVMKFPQNGSTVQCWELSEEELKQVAETGKIFVSQWTFDEPLQPILLATELSSVLPDGIEPYDTTKVKQGDVLLLWAKQLKTHCTAKVHSITDNGEVLLEHVDDESKGSMVDPETGVVMGVITDISF